MEKSLPVFITVVTVASSKTIIIKAGSFKVVVAEAIRMKATLVTKESAAVVNLAV